MKIIIKLVKINYQTPINILISEPKIAKEVTLIVKPIYSYCIQCSEHKSDVRRKYVYFERLKNQLNIRYPLRLVPVVIKDMIVE